MENGEIDEELREKLGINPHFYSRWPNELSGGQLQRFCVMRVLNPQTKFIIPDEISTMLDTITQSQIWNVILEYAKKYNIGILTITHNPHLAKVICTRVVKVEDL
ncbi:hypothetical protein [Niallia sp. NCCP-28]|uniref:hypothetical protein n=1 Tax=Niallia sp. NCCP-28 TaxID=2934712 RepID=UPI00208CCF15|nr:hypothetical protein [Niallia sp. NCCP-28]GKU80671.1 hypothetical protein NCCP28_00670 [Niallia sp. NCCP-28]